MGMQAVTMCMHQIASLTGMAQGKKTSKGAKARPILPNVGLIPNRMSRTHSD